MLSVLSPCVLVPLRPYVYQRVLGGPRTWSRLCRCFWGEDLVPIVPIIDWGVKGNLYPPTLRSSRMGAAGTHRMGKPRFPHYVPNLLLAAVFGYASRLGTISSTRGWVSASATSSPLPRDPVHDSLPAWGHPFSVSHRRFISHPGAYDLPLSRQLSQVGVELRTRRSLARPPPTRLTGQPSLVDGEAEIRSLYGQFGVSRWARGAVGPPCGVFFVCCFACSSWHCAQVLLPPLPPPFAGAHGAMRLASAGAAGLGSLRATSHVTRFVVRRTLIQMQFQD